MRKIAISSEYIYREAFPSPPICGGKGGALDGNHPVDSQVYLGSSHYGDRGKGTKDLSETGQGVH